VAVTDIAPYQMMLRAISTLFAASGLVYGALQLWNWGIAQHVADFTKLESYNLS
jgi:hypothetical protein